MDNKFLLYTTASGNVDVSVYLEDETLWLTQKEITILFGVSKSTISEHFKNIFESGELEEIRTVRKFRTVRQEGERQVTRELEHYNLDAIISVGYRVNSAQATQFRIWATQILKEFIQKGFVLDDERLKQGKAVFGQDYFRELLERVRSIRASERRVWQQITDIFRECSIDYDKHSSITRQFYANVQNKFHYAITGQTAAEIVYTSANKNSENMGLTTWKSSPEGRVLLSDTFTAKNYLTEKQIRQLERAVTSYFDYIESLIERGDKDQFTMEKLADSVNRFLSFNEYQVLDGYGQVSAEQAKEKARVEYAAFNKEQKIISDFDKKIKQLAERSDDN
ncbi:virulence RhuM family protein [Psychrobacter sp. YGAH215]|uniref:virulence RhuM family protein n=1 Tax=unclassified Psychrobacter TaxID=196806 RepID=UPI000713A0FC|nr:MULTISPECIES: virulence RhuM family protein [unclassified Psychrobacter]KRG32535.1 cell filamentation protein Fic [Psychrobacter sp. P11F6]TSB22927.1 virulence RhuM family protein [Psychrobacter sp. YGAH215]